VALGQLSTPDYPFRQPVPLLFSSTSLSDPDSLSSKDMSVSEMAVEMTQHLIGLSVSSKAQQSPLERLDVSATVSQLAIATLPIHLFCHEDSRLLAQQLRQTLSQESQDANTYQQVLIVGLVLGQILNNQFQADSMVPSLYQALVKLLNTTPHAPLIDSLDAVQRLLQGRVSLQIALDHLASTALDPTIALALYCFLSTPENMQLALLRSARLSYQFPHVSGLTGMLSGAYNTMITLPLEWQRVLTDSNCCLIGSMTGKELRQLATHLLSVWAGAEDSATFSDLAPAVAAPGVMRPVEYR
jgi:hypothetical protein